MFGSLAYVWSLSQLLDSPGRCQGRGHRNPEVEGSAGPRDTVGVHLSGDGVSVVALNQSLKSEHSWRRVGGILMATSWGTEVGRGHR